MRFVVSIDIKHKMQDRVDVAKALDDIAALQRKFVCGWEGMYGHRGNISDVDGNIVGTWELVL